MTADIRNANIADIIEIEKAFADGRAFLCEQGLPQWQNGNHPTKQMAENDIHKQEGYVLVVSGKVCGYAALMTGIDDCYTQIDGAWNDIHPVYISIHRLSLQKTLRGKGLSKIFMRLLIQQAQSLGYKDIRIDTHAENKIMIKLIASAGFSYCGIITFPFLHGERNAYQIIT